MAKSYPVSTIAKLFGITERRVQQLAREGIIPKPEKNQYALAGCVHAYVAYLRQCASGKNTNLHAVHQERARLLKAQADMAEIELAQKSKRLGKAPQVKADWQFMLDAWRTKLLVLPSEVELQLSNQKTADDIKDYLTHAIHEALNELAEYIHNDEK